MSSNVCVKQSKIGNRAPDMSSPRKLLPTNNYVWRIESEIRGDRTAVNKLCVQSMYQYIHHYSCKSHLDGYSLLSSDNHIISYLILSSKQECSTMQLNLSEALLTSTTTVIHCAKLIPRHDNTYIRNRFYLGAPLNIMYISRMGHRIGGYLPMSKYSFEEQKG